MGPLGSQPVQQLEVAKGVLQPSTHAAQQNESPVAQLQTLTKSVDHVSIILLRWELDHIGMGGGATQGIKVAHHKVRRDAVGHQGVIATVGGDDVVPRSGVGAQRGGQGHGPHHITDALVIGHDKTFFFREHKRPGKDRENS